MPQRAERPAWSGALAAACLLLALLLQLAAGAATAPAAAAVGVARAAAGATRAALEQPRARVLRARRMKGAKPAVPEHPSQVKAVYAVVRADLDSAWPETPDRKLPCRDATKAGFIGKEALVGESATLRLQQSQAHQYYNLGLPIYGACQIYISHKWQFIFIRQPKSSSTAVLQEIKDNMCAVPGECTDHELLFTNQIDDLQWSSYFVFTFVRNPWTRVLSAYDMMTKHFLRRRSGSKGKEMGEKCGLTLSSFTQDTNNMRKLCPREDCCTWIPPTVGFVPAFIDLHINDQAHCVFLSDGRSLVDFVGRTEHIDQDWPVVLAEVNRRSGSTFVQQGSVVNPNGHGDEALGKIEHSCASDALLDAYTPETLQNVARQYSMDIERYGFLV